MGCESNVWGKTSAGLLRPGGSSQPMLAKVGIMGGKGAVEVGVFQIGRANEARGGSEEREMASGSEFYLRVWCAI